MNLHQHLVSVRARIKDPSHWTTGTCARDSQGRPLSEADTNDLCAFCLMGAVLHEAEMLTEASIEDYSPDKDVLRSKLLAAVDDSVRALHGHCSIPTVNDNPNLGHPAVLAVLDHAIARSQAHAVAS